jgi:hypothetical protein
LCAGQITMTRNKVRSPIDLKVHVEITLEFRKLHHSGLYSGKFALVRAPSPPSSSGEAACPLPVLKKLSSIFKADDDKLYGGCRYLLLLTGTTNIKVRYDHSHVEC